MKGYTIWFTGLHCSGKTTIANELAKELKKRDIKFVFLDDDKIRNILSPDLGTSKYENYRHTIRLANVCYLISSNQIMTIVCTVSPARKLRTYARSMIKHFVEIQIRESPDLCSERAKTKGIQMDLFYEKGDAPEIIITPGEVISESVSKILKYLEAEEIV